MPTHFLDKSKQFARDVAVNAASIGSALGEQVPLDFRRDRSRAGGKFERIAFVWYADDIAMLALALTEAEYAEKKKNGYVPWNEGWPDYESTCVLLAKTAGSEGKMNTAGARHIVKMALKSN